MRKLLTASKDTTIYQSYPNINAGFDEILEVGKMVSASNPTGSYSSGSARTLLYFDLPTTASVNATADYFLNLRLANASNIKRNQTVLVYQISRSWDEGSGYLYQTDYNNKDGATWNQATTSTSWSLAGGDILTASASASTVLTSYPLEDLRINVTNILRPIVSQSLQSTFKGLVVQFPISDETDINNEGSLKIFSTQTHTIHQPTLEIAWDNQTMVTGSLTAIPSVDVKVGFTNLRENYTKGDIAKVKLTVRDEYPLRSFDSTLRYKNKYYLPSSSYYSVTDVQSNTTVIPFDNYSKISTDPTGSYIVLDTSPLYQGRFYKLNVKVDYGDYSRTITNDVLFKVN